MLIFSESYYTCKRKDNVKFDKIIFRFLLLQARTVVLLRQDQLKVEAVATPGKINPPENQHQQTYAQLY